MRWGVAVVFVLAGLGCSSFGSETGGSAPADAATTASDAGASPDAPGAGWCSSNYPGAVFCDDFEGDWTAAGKGWEPRGAVERVDRAAGDKALRAHLALTATPITADPVALYKLYPKGKVHVVYSFDFQVVTLTPVLATDYYSVPLSLLLFAGGARSTVDVEHVPPGGGPVEWNLRVIGYNFQPDTVLGGPGFTGNAWHRVHVDARSVPAAADRIGVKYDGIPSATETDTTFAEGEDMTIMIGLEMTKPGTVDYLFDNFVVEVLE